jgi:hypothetical protein
LPSFAGAAWAGTQDRAPSNKVESFMRLPASRAVFWWTGLANAIHFQRIRG